MTFAIRTLQQLRRSGCNETSDFTFVFVGDALPAKRPHCGEWDEAEDHWSRTNLQFSRCVDVVPPSVTGKAARQRVEQAAILFLYVCALDEQCWACEADND